METHQPQHHLHHRSASLSDVAQDKKFKIIRFSSRPKTNQSSDNNPTPTTSGHRSGESKKQDPLLRIIISFFTH